MDIWGNYSVHVKVQASFGPLLWFPVSPPLEPDSVLTALWTSSVLTTNLTGTPSFRGQDFSKELTEAESTQHQSLLSYQTPSSNSTFPQSLMQLPLKQVCLQKLLKMVLVIAVIYLAVLKWWFECLLCAKSLNRCFICIPSPRKVKAQRHLRPQKGPQQKG